jgi:hypothetical protein
MSHYFLGFPLPSDIPSVNRRPLHRMAFRVCNIPGCRDAYIALSNIEETYRDYNNKSDIQAAIRRTGDVRFESMKSVRFHHEATGCLDCHAMQAFIRLHNDSPGDTQLDIAQIVCEIAKNTLPSAYGHLVLGLVFSVVAGLRSLPSADRDLSLHRAILHLRHCDHLHIGCLYLGHACAKLGQREAAFKAYQKGSTLGLRVLCMKGTSECYRSGFGVEQDSRQGQKIGREVDSNSGTLKDVFFKEWERNVKSGENLAEWFKKLLQTTDFKLQPKGHVVPATPAAEATPSGETPTGLWL